MKCLRQFRALRCIDTAIKKRTETEISSDKSIERLGSIVLRGEELCQVSKGRTSRMRTAYALDLNTLGNCELSN